MLLSCRAPQPLAAGLPSQQRVQCISPWLQRRFIRKPGRSGAMAASNDAILHSIQQMFHDRAAGYDQDNAHHTVLAQLGQRILDLASGTGLVALSAAAAVGPTGAVVAVDITEAMLEQSRSKYALLQQSNELPTQQPAQPASTAVHHVLGDMEDLESCLPADWKGTFDLITCSSASPFLRDPSAAIAEWRQWLKPGRSSKLAFNAFKAPFVRDFGTFSALAGQYGLHDEIDPAEVLGSEERLRAVLQQAGFTETQVSTETAERWYAAPSLDAHCDVIWNLGVKNMFMNPSRLDVLGEKQKDFREALAAAVKHNVLKEGRHDSERERVLNPCTVLNVIAKLQVV